MPSLTSTVRGFAVFDLEVATLDHPVHSGSFGGPVPDAFMALARLLATLHDENGDVAISGLDRDDLLWNKAEEVHLRANSAVLEGVPLVGTGSLEARLYGHPAVNVVGLNVVGLAPTSRANHVLCARAKARISLRLAPSQDVERASRALEEHLERVQAMESSTRSSR